MQKIYCLTTVKSNKGSATTHSGKFSDEVHKHLSIVLFPGFVDFVERRIPGNISNNAEWIGFTEQGNCASNHIQLTLQMQ